ncbi:NADP-dependent 3-hydroxy acid dehydrogenase YdfG [Pseudonocardia thermophila]|uniref:NADP-dependent 3-hydroxy acid dehydrogenase YdfG n=1 Tax=Pseudonocardia thermophila TaxID=1848 RepID=A0A1M6VHY2_PSETH|nr:NADP-dependent 3-hydroxy acid dehydrogenase YdfG [Pseudonocardia thermophila]
MARVLAPGYDVLLGGRDTARLEALAAELPGARAWPVDLTDHDEVAEAVGGIDSLDVLVHSAGIGEIGTVADTPAEVWRREYEINVVAVAELTRLLLPALRRAGGRVVLLNSGSGLVARPGWGPYAASKFALRAFADALRAEEAPNGVRVTSLHVGRTATDMQRHVVEQEGGTYDADQYLRPESVAGAVMVAVTAPDDAALTELSLRPF